MSDRLTQLQDCLDQLATQFYASIRYLSNNHPPSALPSHPPLIEASPPAPNPPAFNAPAPTDPSISNNASSNQSNPPDLSNITTSANPLSDQNPNANANMAPLPPAATPISFSAAQKELARDLLTKTRQITYLISVLPGVENSEKEQEERVHALEHESREVEAERVQAVQEMEVWQGRLEGVIGNVRR